MTTEPAPAAAPAGGISVRGVRRSFGDVHAVRDVTFDAAPGRITALVGPNGSGKTTLMLILASLLAPDAGTITVGGIDPVVDPSAARAVLGWMPDALGAWPSLTARETLVTAARMYRIPRAEASDRARELLALVRLDDLADKPARVFSRGQQQRLGLARALVHEPTVLLLDEPASGLDPQSRVDLRVTLKRLAEQGRTILISSHVLSELDELADDAVFLQSGRTVSSERVAQARTALRDWRLRVLDQPPQAGADAATAALREIGVSEALIRRDRDALVVAFASDHDAAAALSKLVAAGVLLAEFAPATGRLEQTFLDLNGGDEA